MDLETQRLLKYHFRVKLEATTYAQLRKYVIDEAREKEEVIKGTEPSKMHVDTVSGGGGLDT